MNILFTIVTLLIFTPPVNAAYYGLTLIEKGVYEKSKTYSEWSDWSDIYEMYECSIWSPERSSVNYSVPFIQTRMCSQDQIRERSLYSVLSDGSKSLISKEDDFQIVEIEETQNAIGSNNYIVNTEMSEGDWLDSGAAYNCSSWSPNTSSIRYGTSFTQSSNCSLDQIKTKTTYNYWADGTETEEDSYSYKTISNTKTKSAVGISTIVNYNLSGGTTLNCANSWTIENGVWFYDQSGVKTCDGTHFVMQSDGNLVLYYNGVVKWNSNTDGYYGADFVKQSDGNLVVYYNGVAKWNSNTAGNYGTRLVISNGGSLILYSSNNSILWSK